LINVDRGKGVDDAPLLGALAKRQVSAVALD
jgi:lactate dehydrogenase-like 2-hydroxyacid dehydrogenase